MACPTLIWWEGLNGFIRLGFGTWGVPQGVPKCFRGRGLWAKWARPIGPKNHHTRTPPPFVRSGGLGLDVWCLGQKHLNLILFFIIINSIIEFKFVRFFCSS